MKSLAFVINSRIKNKAALLKSLKTTAASQESFSFVWEETCGSKSAIALAKKFAEEDHSHIIAVGGDGTIHEVVNGIMQSENTDVQLGILPWGTANDFCKTIEAANSVADLMHSILRGSHQQLDVGYLQYQENDTNSYFINIADLGIGAEVVERVNSSPKILSPDLIFMGAIIRTFLSYNNQPIEIKTPEWTWKGMANSVVIANAKYFGSGLCIAPNADPTDGVFEIVISGDISIYDYLKNVRRIKAGKLIDHPEVHYKTASDLEISSPQQCGLEADGEFLGFTPVKISIADRKLRVIKKPAK